MAKSAFPKGLNKERELSLELLGLNGLDPFFDMSTAARKAMFSTHVGQATQPSGVEPRRIFTGMEFELGKDVFGIKFPCDVIVLDVISKYQSGGMGQDTIPENSVITIIYQEYYRPTRIGVINVPTYLNYHPDFGYPLVRNEAVWERLRPNEAFEKDTVIATSKAVDINDGSYGYGIQVETVYLSTPGVIEDGIEFSESFCKRISPKGYGKVIGDWGKKMFPLNLHGDHQHYRPFLEIGDTVPDDGLIMAFRDTNPRLGIADMTPHATRTLRHSYDKAVWGRPGAKIKDIKVYHDDRLNPSLTPVGMDSQARKYYDQLCQYYKKILDWYFRMRKRYGAAQLELTPELNSLIVEAKIYLPTPMGERKLTRVNRLDILDEWRIEIEYEWDLPVNDGYKATDGFGGLYN